MTKKINIKKPVRITTFHENVVFKKTEKVYYLCVGEKKSIIHVNKWWDSDGEDCDYEIANEKQIKKILTEEEWDALTDYIYELD